MSDDHKDIKKSFGESYTASSIGGDLGLKGIRLSPSQYLGSRGVEGAMQSTWEIVQNGVDEASAFYNFYLENGVKPEDIPLFQIDIRIHKDDSVIIEDTGRGIPIDMHPKFNRPTIEAAFEEINVGGKGHGYVEGGQSAYKAKTIGKHGSGAACANATSDFFYVDTFLLATGEHYRVEYEAAEKTVPLKHIGKSPEGKHGTRVHFRSNKTEVFQMYSNKYGEVERFFVREDMLAIIKEYAFNTDKIQFNFHFENEDGTWSLDVVKSEDFIPENRIKPYIKNKVHHCSIDDPDQKYSLDMYIGIASTSQHYLSCNMVPLKSGTHFTAVNEALNLLMDDVLKSINNQLRSGSGRKVITDTDYMRMNLRRPSLMVSMYLSLSMADPDYDSQSKGSLESPRIKNSIVRKVTEAFENDLADLKAEIIEDATRIAVSVIEAQDLHEKEKERKKKRAEEEKRRKDLLKTDSDSDVEGLADDESEIVHAACTDHSKVILYLAEGLSAEGLLAKARDANSSTVMPITSRPPNVLIHTEAKLATMPKFRLLYRYFSKKYRAIVLATDPDPDGQYMRALILMFLYKYPEFRRYLTEGRVFNLKLPKFIANKGDQHELIYSEAHRVEHYNATAGSWTYASIKGVGSISVDIMKVILQTQDSFEKIDPSTIDEGMKVIERFLTDSKFKKWHILNRYSDHALQAHMQSRRSLLKYHELSYDIFELGEQFIPEADLTDVRRETALETMMRLQTSSIDADLDLTSEDLSHSLVAEELEGLIEDAGETE